MLNKGSLGVNGSYEMELDIYTMFNHFNLKFKSKKNLIVDNGLEFFLKRLIDNELQTISKISLGTGTRVPVKSDTDLQSKTVTVNSTNSIELANKRIKMVGQFNSSQVNGTTEIGVFTQNNRLVSRNVHEAISIPSSSSMTINYYYSFAIGSYKYDWAKTTNFTNVYEISESVKVKAVLEEDTGNGYTKKTSKTLVDNAPASYYYDETENKLYIHTSDSVTPNNNHAINISY